MAPPRRPSRRSESEESEQAPQESSTRIRSAASRRSSSESEEDPEDNGAGEDYGDGDGDERTGGTADGEDSLPFSGDDDDNSESTRAGPPLTLEIIEGPDKGKRRPFKSVRVVIGRGDDCDVMLLDQSVSRRHVELVYGGESGVMLRDLVSGNGTKVNDERVDERKLNHEDVIAIGRTKLRFVDEQERHRRKRQEAEEAERKEKEEAERKVKEAEERKQKAAEAKAAAEAAAASGAADPNAPGTSTESGTQVRDVRNIPRRAAGPRNPVGLVVAVALVLLVVLISGGVLFIKRGPPPPPPTNPKLEKAKGMLQEARNAFRRGDYQEAVNLATDADALFPGVDTEGFLNAAKAELSIVQAFAQVRALMAANKFDEAHTALDDTPHGAAQTTEEMRTKLTSDLAEAEAAWNVKQVEEALAARDPELALSLIQKLPLERQPLYRAKVAELEAQLAQESTNSASRDRAARAAAARRAKEQREAFIAAAFSTVSARFQAGDFGRATLECDRVVDANADDKEIRERARSMKKLIPQFERYYKDGQRKMQAGALDTAARSLRSAAELYRQIALPGPIGETLDSQLSQSAVAAGRSSLGRGDIADAASFFQEALRLRPGDPKAEAGMAELQGKLENVYKRAYIQRDRDPEGSAETFRLISKLAPEGSDLKSRADAQLMAPAGDALPTP